MADKPVEKDSGMFKKSRKAREDALQDVLTKGEEIVAEAYISRGIYWQTIVVLVVSVILGIYVFPLGVLLAVTGILMLIYNTLRKEILMLVMTNKRLLMRYGILQIDVVDMRFDKVESIELERMLPGYMMGYANIVISGTGQRYVTIPYVGNARRFRRAYNDLVFADDKAPQEVVVVEDKS